jgi:hypothetical protein
MTWIGTCNSDEEPGAARQPKQIDDPTASVHVHWGGLGGADHHGVFLRGNADWAQYLYKVCRGVHGKAKVANVNAKGKSVDMTLDEFLKRFPHYRIGSHRTK